MFVFPVVVESDVVVVAFASLDTFLEAFDSDVVSFAVVLVFAAAVFFSDFVAFVSSVAFFVRHFSRCHNAALG